MTLLSLRLSEGEKVLPAEGLTKMSKFCTAPMAQPLPTYNLRVTETAVKASTCTVSTLRANQASRVIAKGLSAKMSLGARTCSFN